MNPTYPRYHSDGPSQHTLNQQATRRFLDSIRNTAHNRGHARKRR